MNTSLLKLIAATSLALGLLAPAQATVLTFETAATGDLSTYAGFNWDNARVIDVAAYAGIQGVEKSAVSGTQVVVARAYGFSDGLSSDTAFSLNSGYFTSYNGIGVPLTATAYLNGNLVGTQTFMITNLAPTFLTFNQTLFGNVTQVTFNNYAGNLSTGNALAFDDLTVNATVEGDVPEPASIALLGLGLLGLTVVRRLRKA